MLNAEGTRKFHEIDVVTVIKPGAIFTAIENDSLIIPQATAGLSKLKVGEKPDRRTVAKDRVAPFGRDPHNPFKKGLPLVLAFGKPFRFDKPAFPFSMSKSAGRIVRSQSTDYVRECAEILRHAMDSTIKRAYEVRGSMLEDRLDV